MLPNDPFSENDPPPRSPDRSSAADRLDRARVGVVVERRHINRLWQEYSWRPVEVITDGLPTLEPWSMMRTEDDVTWYYAGPFELELYPRETPNYLDNLAMADPAVFVVLRPDPAAAAGMQLVFVTLSPADAQAYAGDGAHLVDRVRMPAAIAAWLSDYVAAHHVEEPFRKRRRDRVGPNRSDVAPASGESGEKDAE